MNNTTQERRSPVLTGLVLAGALSLAVAGGCSGVRQSATAPGAMPPQSAEIETMLARMVPRSDLQKTVKEGLVALGRGDYEAAGQAFQAGLRLEPGNGHLHFLNALTYHLRGRSGDTKMLDLARAGYLTALKLDESNYMAAYLLGQIHFRERDYRTAQNYFAYGLLYAPDDPHLLNALAAASYYTRDPATALWASQKAYGLAPGNPASIRNVMFAEAATGQFTKTPRLMREYATAARHRSGDGDAFWLDAKLDQASTRLQDWKKFYVAANDPIFSTPSSDIVTYSSGKTGNGDAGDAAPPADTGETSSDKPITGAPPPGGEAGKAEANRPKMTNIDVVIIRTEEVRSQSKGVNLLEGLKATLNGTLFNYSYSKTEGSAAGSETIQTSFNPYLTLAGLEYNLNIFNDGINKAEVLARPSLLATENVTSQFFSGGVLHVQLSSNNYDGGLEDISIGISLNVTPKFLDTDTLSVAVQADHEFLEMQNENVGFSAFAQTTKTSVQATAVLKFGETLILSGLSERDRDASASGVPILQDIPGVQYLFSHKAETETKKSILILLTPRKPRYAEDTMTTSQLDGRKDLEVIYVDKLKTVERIRNTNLNAATAHLGNDSQFYRQFRTGDIELKFFEDDDSFFGSIKRTLGFFYY